MDKSTNTDFTLPANQKYPLASEPNWSATRDWPVRSPLSLEEKDEKCHYNILAFDCGHSIPHPYLPGISHVSTCQYPTSTPGLSCSNMGTSTFTTQFRDCDKCTKSKLDWEDVSLNGALEMKELSPKLQEKFLPKFEMEGAFKEPLETKRTLPTKFYQNPKVLGCGQLDPAVKNSSKPKTMSANMTQKLSEDRLESSGEYSAKQKKSVTFDMDKHGFGGDLPPRARRISQDGMSPRSLMLAVLRKLDSHNIVGITPWTPKGIEGCLDLSESSPLRRYFEMYSILDFELVNSTEQLDKQEESLEKLPKHIATDACQTGDDAESAMGIGGIDNGDEDEDEDADWEFVDAE